jgi:putative transposase
MNIPSGKGRRYRQCENLKETNTMPSRRVDADLNAGTYYLTLTIQRWYYLFDRHNRWQILAEPLRYCLASKGLKLNGYVFMLNPIRLIARHLI